MTLARSLEISLRKRLWEDCGAVLAYASYNFNGRRDLDKGLPPHSVRFTVLGGEDSEVAESIYFVLPVGIRTVGEYCVEEGNYGIPMSIRFDRIYEVECV